MTNNDTFAFTSVDNDGDTIEGRDASCPRYVLDVNGSAAYLSRTDAYELGTKLIKWSNNGFDQ